MEQRHHVPSLQRKRNRRLAGSIWPDDVGGVAGAVVDAAVRRRPGPVLRRAHRELLLRRGAAGDPQERAAPAGEAKAEGSHQHREALRSPQQRPVQTHALPALLHGVGRVARVLGCRGRLLHPREVLPSQ